MSAEPAGTTARAPLRPRRPPLAPLAPRAADDSCPAPRPVLCVIEHLHRSREVADAACVGRFTSAGVTLDLGAAPDWLQDGLRGDEEWRIEWSKFYFGLDLAVAYRETGEARYLETWERLVRSWVQQVPVDADPSDVIGRRLQNWVYAWQGFTATGRSGPSRPTVDLLLATIAEQLGHLRANLTPGRNHRTLELHAELVVALSLPQLDPDGALVDLAWTQLHRNLLEDVWPDGVHRECSTHYHLVALRSFLAARENARRFGLAIPDGYDERLRLACRFALHVHRPDGFVPALSDADSEDHTDVLALADQLVDLPGLRWVATGGRVGPPPQERSVAFVYGGYAVQRSGWGEGPSSFADERYLVLDVGPVGDGGHGHYDVLSIEAYGRGRPLVVDPGRFTYSEEDPNWRRWFKSTAAHNTVTVDGRDQTPYRRGKPPKDQAASGRLLSRYRAGGFDLLCGQASSPGYQPVHTRHVAFVAGEYWVVVDDLTADDGALHQYTQRMHLPAAAWERTAVVDRGDDVAVRAPDVALLYPAGAHPIVAAGWVSTAYGVKNAAPIVTRTVASTSSARMVTVLWPAAGAGGEPPRLTVNDVDPGMVSVRLAGVGADASRTDHVAWLTADASSRSVLMAVGPAALSGRVAWVRTDPDGRPEQMAVHGDHLAWSGTGPRTDAVDRGDGWRLLPAPGWSP